MKKIQMPNTSVVYKPLNTASNANLINPPIEQRISFIDQLLLYGNPHGNSIISQTGAISITNSGNSDRYITQITISVIGFAGVGLVGYIRASMSDNELGIVHFSAIAGETNQTIVMTFAIPILWKSKENINFTVSPSPLVNSSYCAAVSSIIMPTGYKFR